MLFKSTDKALLHRAWGADELYDVPSPAGVPVWHSPPKETRKKRGKTRPTSKRWLTGQSPLNIDKAYPHGVLLNASANAEVIQNTNKALPHQDLKCVNAHTEALGLPGTSIGFRTTSK
eukprot:1139488-Pelagomonas_calceolata.AAC.2